LNNKLQVNLNYISNFNTNFFKNFDKFKNKNKKKIICRNFFLFLFLLNFFKNFLCSNIKLFVKPKKKSFINVLKAPYKNKLSKHQIGFFRYFINFKLTFFISTFIFINSDQFCLFFNKFVYFFKVFETNVISNYKITFLFQFKLLNFFNFKKLN
jgi:hypothetical protein